MSYNSRVYRQRNAHTHDEGKKEKFFSKENDAAKAKSKSAFFQPKLNVNEPGDKYEQEADSVASHVVNKPAKGTAIQNKKISSIQRLATPVEDEKLGTNDARMEKDKLIQEKPVQRAGTGEEKEKKDSIQKMDNPEKEKKDSIQKMDSPEKEKKDSIQKKDIPEKEKKDSIQKMDNPEKEKKESIQKMDAPEKENKENIQKKEDPLKEEEKKTTAPIQKKPAGHQSTASTGLSSSIESASGKGEALPAKTKKEMNSSFGVDFGNVRIHKGSDAAEMNKELEAQAFTHGSDIYFDEGKFDPDSTEGKFLLAHELTHVIQQDSQPEKLQKDDKKPAAKPLIEQFGDKFPDSVDIIKKSPEALLLIKDATTAGVEFGGFSEEGPGKMEWPYTNGSKVYVPKSHKAKKVVAASDFLFELNNGIHASGFKVLDTEASKGSKGTLTAKEFAKKNVEIEVDGMLRLGKVWVEMKKSAPKGENWNIYDDDFFLRSYEDFKSGKKTKDDIVKEVLQGVYPEGIHKGKTIEKFYMDQYNDLSGGK